MGVTTPELLERLRAYHPPPEWLSYRECWGIDFFAWRCWSSGTGHLRVGYEVKISRADFHAESRKTHEHERAREVCHRFYYCVPAGLVEPREVPEWAGLVTVEPGRRPKMVKQSPHNESPRAFRESEMMYLARMPWFQSRRPDYLREIERLSRALDRTRSELVALKQAEVASTSDSV